MKKVIVGTVVGLMIGAAIPATAHHGPSVRNLNRRVTNLEEGLDCIVAVPISQYGNPAIQEGYSYRTNSGQEIRTTALDFTAQGDEISSYMATVDPACINTNKVPVKKQQPGKFLK